MVRARVSWVKVEVDVRATVGLGYKCKGHLTVGWG